MTIAPAMLLTVISIGFNGTIALLAVFGVISAGTMIHFGPLVDVLLPV